LAETVNVRRSNTILYCSEWASTVTFNRDVIALEPTHEVETSDPMPQWGGRSVFLHDPESTRIELWEAER
jgi:hypothetical protein|tara:strand:+ start:281 stop:490 length:210 start_codon:yes stop_codon:yes gene_type:complete